MFSKSFLRAPSTPLRFCVAALLIAATAIMLTACGGGGGTTTPPATGGTYTATSLCASGPALTSTVSQAAANALVPNSCPAVPTTGVTVNVVGGMLVVNGLPPGVTVATSSFTAISGGSTVVFTNGALTSGTLLSGATYTYSGAQVTFTNAPNVIIAGTFVSPVIVVCIAPAMLNTANACISAPAATGYTWNSVVAGGVWVADIGVLVSTANLLPVTSFVIGDAAWLTAAANGTIKYVKTASIKQQDSRPLIYAFYKTTNAPGGNGNTEYYAVTAMYADVVATSAFANQNVENGSGSTPITQVKGSIGGAKFLANDGSFERAWDGANFTNTQLGPVGSSI